MISMRHTCRSRAGTPAGSGRRSGRAIAPAAIAVLLAAACTSGGDEDRSTAPASSPPSSGTASTGPPASGSPSVPTGRLSAIDGAALVLGPTEDRADVYRVSDGKFRRVTRSADVTSVSIGAGHTVVGVAAADGDESVRELRGTALRDVGVPAGFDPSVSRGGALAWVSVDSAASTPGVTKPKGFALTVRTALRGAGTVVLRTPQSMASAHWVDEHTIVVAAAKNDRTQLVRVDTRTHSRTILATIADAEDLEIAAGRRVASVVTGSGAVLVVLGSRALHPFARGWTPLCWPDDDTVLATRSGRLATVPVSTAGEAATPRVVGTLPPGTTAYGAACG